MQVSAMIVMGRPITAMSQGASEEEDEKRLFSVLMQGDQMVSIDNVTRPIGGDALCTITTNHVAKSRPWRVAERVRQHQRIDHRDRQQPHLRG